MTTGGGGGGEGLATPRISRAHVETKHGLPRLRVVGICLYPCSRICDFYVCWHMIIKLFPHHDTYLTFKFYGISVSQAIVSCLANVRALGFGWFSLDWLQLSNCKITESLQKILHAFCIQRIFLPLLVKLILWFHFDLPTLSILLRNFLTISSRFSVKGFFSDINSAFRRSLRK